MKDGGKNEVNGKKSKMVQTYYFQNDEFAIRNKRSKTRDSLNWQMVDSWKDTNCVCIYVMKQEMLSCQLPIIHSLSSD